MKRTVLYVLGFLGAGGAERQLLSLLQLLDRDRWNPIVAGTRDGALADRFREVAPLYVLDKRRKIDISVALKIRRLIIEHNVSVVHGLTFTGNLWSRLGAVLTRERSPIRIASELGMSSEKPPHLHAVDRALIGCTDMVEAISRAVAEDLARLERIPPHLVRVIHNGIDLARAQEALHRSAADIRAHRQALGIADDAFVITHVGRPNPVKNLELLLRVFKRIHAQFPNTHLLRVSQEPAPEEREYAGLFPRGVAESGLDEFVTTHPFTSKISEVYSISDALIQTSRNEGMPNVVMEALAMGLPVVATAAGGTTDLVLHRKTGWITGVHDEDALVEGLAHAIQYPVEAAEWGQAGRERIEAEFTDRVMTDRTMALYDELLRRRGEAP